MCLVLIFLNTFVEKKHTLNPEITLLYLFHDQKAVFKVPKICNITFWIENAPPLWNFSENSSDLLARPFPKRCIFVPPKYSRDGEKTETGLPKGAESADQTLLAETLFKSNQHSHKLDAPPIQS